MLVKENKISRSNKRILHLGIEKAVIGNTIGDIGSTIQHYIENKGSSVLESMLT